MDHQFPVFAPLGRLYDPLLQLAERVHRALATKQKTVWTDANGYVFATPTDQLRSIAPHATVGIHDTSTPLHVIEWELRLALRERASSWITDWKTQPLNTECASRRTLHLMPPRKRRRKAKDGATPMAMPFTFPNLQPGL